MANKANLSSVASNSSVPLDKFSHEEISSDENHSINNTSKKTGPKPHEMDPASVAKRARRRKYYLQRIQNETVEERQERIACRRKYLEEYYKNLKPEEKERRLQRIREKRTSDFYKKFYQNLLMTETEEERTRRIEYKKIHCSMKMMLMTEEERTKRKQRVSEYMKQKLLKETPEERKARLEYKKEVNRKFKERETPEEYLQRMKLTNERNKKRKLNETPEERQRRLERQKMYNRKRSQEMTPEELEERRQRDRERWKNMTEEQRQRKRELARLAGIKRRRNETPEQRARRRENYHRYVRRKNMQMTEAEREARLEQEREYQAKRRMQETEEKRGRRLEHLRRYNKCCGSRRKSKTSGECTGTGIAQPDGSQGNAEASSTATKRPRRSAKSTAGSNIRHQLEHEAFGAVSDELTDALDIRNSFNKKVSDLHLRTERRRWEMKMDDDAGTFSGYNEHNCSAENRNLSVFCETKRPSRRTKLCAKIRIHQQLEGETLNTSEHPLQVQKEVKIIDKLKLRAVVLLERIREVDWHGKFTVRQMSEESMKTGENGQRKRNQIQCGEKCNDRLIKIKSTNNEHDGYIKLMEKWGLRPLVIRLERIDVAETIQKVKDRVKWCD